MPVDLKKNTSSDKTSDELVEELLSTIRNREKKYISEEVKEKKHRKYKKEKKKKHKHHRSRSRERKCNKRSRSRSKENKSHRKRRKRNSSSLHEPVKYVEGFTKKIEENLKSSSSNETTDDLPVNADFQTVIEGLKSSETLISDKSPLDPENLSCAPEKDIKEKTNPSQIELKNDFETLKKKSELKDREDFIPCNVKLKKPEDASNKNVDLIAAHPIYKNTKTITPSIPTQKLDISSEIDAPIINNAQNNDNVLKQEEKTNLKEELKSPIKNANKEWEFSIKPLPLNDKSSEIIEKKGPEKHKKKSQKKSNSPNRSHSLEKTERRKKHRSRSRKRSKSRERKRSRSRDRHRRSRSRTRRSRSRNRSFRKRSWSRDYSRSRSRSEDRIDKAKLLQIAKKRRAAGIFDIGDDNPKSVEDFVSYCEKLQRRQEREDRRARGETVSDDESDSSAPTFKHPYKPVNEPIKINIMNSVPLPTKTTEESILDSASLRVVYPVSSGSIHRENMDWQKVEKEPVLLTCSTAQKNFRAMTTIEAEKIRQKAKQLQQTPAFFLPPPPAPPALPQQKIPEKITAFDTLLPPPPPVPATLIIPSEKELIMKEPEDISAVPPRNVAEILAKRVKAQRRLQEDPNDFDAIRDLKLANDKMNTWAAYKTLPGKYTGTTGVDVLSAEQLQPHDPRGNAWVKKDMFKQLTPFGGGIGLRLMQRMGWRPGTGLGRECSGNVDPLVLDVKNDRKGLATGEDIPARPKFLKNVSGADLSGKHPVSLVMELCAKRKWAAPVFTCLESGPPHQREFIWKVVVNGIEYCSATSSKNKKDGKSVACQVVLQSLGLVPLDPLLPVII